MIKKKKSSYKIGMELQNKCGAYLRRKGIFYIHIRSTAGFKTICRKCKSLVIGRLIFGGKKGYPDFMICFDYQKVIFIECKVGKGKLSSEQKIIRRCLTEMGYRYYSVFLFSTFKLIIDETLKQLEIFKLKP